jgi:AcrR family transcriptional regulator
MDTRQRLLDAATEVFLEKGYEGTRVAEIARRAGLTTGAIYGNFEGKADLLSAALAARCTIDGKSVTDALSSEPDVQHRLFLDLLALSARDHTAAEAVDRALRGASDEIARLVAAREQGGIDTEALRGAMELMTVGAIVMRALGRSMPGSGIADVMTVASAIVAATDNP